MNSNFIPKAGSTIANRFRLLDCVGVGATAFVLKCECKKSKRKVALKRYMKDKVTPELKNKVFEEAKLNIVSEYAVLAEEAFQDWQGFLNSVMPLVEGENLRDILQVHGCLNEAHAVYSCLCLAKAACDLHVAGIIAADIKPENTIIEKNGKAKLIDLTFFQYVGSKPKSRMATPPYAPPELVKGERLYESTDVYSIGMTLCELLIGEKDFIDLTNWWQKYSYIPDLGAVYQRYPRAADIIKKAIHPAPSKRYKTSSQFYKDLLNYYNYITGNQASTNRLVLTCSDGQQICLQAGTFTLGRIHVGQKSFYVSERHIEVKYDGNGSAKIRDAGSANGTSINGKRINGRWRKISNGDAVCLADVPLTIKI